MSKKLYKRGKFSLDATLEKSNFNYCKNLKWFIVLPIVIIFTGLILLATIGFNLGIDFTGGSTIRVYANNEGLIESAQVYQIDKKNEDYQKMRDIIDGVLKEEGLSISVFRQTTMDIDYGAGKLNDALCVEFQYQNPDGLSGGDISTLNSSIKSKLEDAFGYKLEGINDWGAAVGSPATVTATASNELLMKAFLAMLVAVVLILIYIAFRFEFVSGLAAILALFHDLLIMASCVLIFRITINSSFVAALLTILGYSINNTIVIFDRIRENIKSGKFEKIDNETVANTSVKETMTRSIYTTLTTLVTIGLVAIIGVTDIRQFAIPLLIGIVAGFYSSVFITPGLWAIAYRPKKKKKGARQGTAKV